MFVQVQVWIRIRQRGFKGESSNKRMQKKEVREEQTFVTRTSRVTEISSAILISCEYVYSLHKLCKEVYISNMTSEHQVN